MRPHLRTPAAQSPGLIPLSSGPRMFQVLQTQFGPVRLWKFIRAFKRTLPFAPLRGLSGTLIFQKHVMHVMILFSRSGEISSRSGTLQLCHDMEVNLGSH